MKYIYSSCLLLATFLSFAQTEIDGIMMEQNNLCIGALYQYSSFDHYWEGKLRRDNLNMGTISNQSTVLMGNYGIWDNLNAIFSVPYVKTEASAGTLMGQKGFQDFSLTLKYMPFEEQFKKYTVSGYVLGGFSIPTTNYVADYLPLSIGFQSKTASIRLMGDIQKGKIYTTFSGTYMARSNIKIDRNSYYTTEYHYTNEVFMPDVITYNFRLGYRTKTLIADIFYDNWITQKGGFDISSNNMPFPSNTMNVSRIGLYAKYMFKKIPNLSALGGFNQVITGRNVGQSTTFNGGFFYVLDFKKNHDKKTNNDENTSLY